jgi:23S rRNA G2445 N2-methylase RlmL
MIEPYYSDDHVTIYHGNCLELADVWHASDVMVTDPPYGETSLAWDRLNLSFITPRPRGFDQTMSWASFHAAKSSRRSRNMRVDPKHHN